MISGSKTNRLKFIYPFIIIAIAFYYFSQSQAEAAKDDEAKEDLKNKIENIRNQIQDYQKQITEKNNREKTIQGDIDIISSDIEKIGLQIQETQLMIQNLDLDIDDKQREIEVMQKEVDAKKKVLANLMQELYERGEATAVEMTLGNETFTDYFFQSDSLESYQERAREIFDQFIVLRDGLKREKENLISKKEEKLNLKMIQTDQQKTLDYQKSAKDVLIRQNRNERLALTEQMEKLEEQLNALQVLGEPIKMSEAIEAARYASELTGVAPEFLLGVLRIESGLGTNVGGGRYKTDMNPELWETFKKICKELGVDAEKAPVSRRVCYNSDAKDGCGGWGGAMGPAQMMPSTWLGYKSKVEKLTGSSPANPWDIKDSMVGMGLKLSAVDGVTNGDRKAWAKAAAMYLAGGNWENYSWYSDRVLFYADGFKKILK